MQKIVITDDRFAGDYGPEEEVLQPLGFEVVHGYQLPPEEFSRALQSADAVLVNQMAMDRERIHSLENCKVISRYGTGYEKIDLDAAWEKGIWVARVPDYCYDEVAEHALALLLGAARKVALIDRKVRSGQWNIHSQLSIPRIRGKVLGILGYGGTGRSLHQKSAGLGFSKTLVCDHHAQEEDLAGTDSQIVSFSQLLEESDFISLHIPMRQENFHLFDHHAFSKMKEGAIIINTARGPIIDHEALLEALGEGAISGAGLDVFEDEPPMGDARFFSSPHLVLTDHSAYFSEESLRELKRKCAENAARVLMGKKPHAWVRDLSTAAGQDGC